MSLFANNKSKNLLPFDGEVYYYDQVFDPLETRSYFDSLLQNIAWEHEELMMFGKKIKTKRKVAWYGSQTFEYTYSRTTKKALIWKNELVKIKEKISGFTGAEYNACLLNLYHNGEEGMAWHSDDEPEIEYDSSIASVSFGAERKFSLKHKTNGEKVSISLENGSLLEMAGETQKHWLHQLPPTKKVQLPRVNLTFRKMKYQ